MIDNIEQTDERDIHANKLFHSLRSVQGEFPPEHFSAALLYFVAALYLTATVGQDDREESVFLRRDPVRLLANMVKLINKCSADLVHRDGLVAALNAEFIRRLMSQFDYLEPSVMRKTGFALRVFDVMLRRIMGEDYALKLDHAHIVASLAVSLANINTGIIETFPYSDSSSVIAKALKKNLDVCYWDHFGYPYSHQDLIKLRLMLRGLTQEPMSIDRYQEDASDYLTLVDGGQTLRGNQFPVFATLEKLIKSATLSDLSLVIVDQAHSHELPAKLREYIIGQDLLEAVIDLPGLDVWGNQTTITAWLLNKRKLSGKKTLVIDATHLVNYGYFESAWFAAAVIERWRSPDLRLNQTTFKTILTSNLTGLFLRYFEDGYNDRFGMCSTQDSAQILEAREWNAQWFLGHQRADSEPLSLDHRELLNIVINETAEPSCSYIIGNNGAGKSLLLKDLVFLLDEARINSVGIAFGATDRFPLELPDNSLFEYQGARGKFDLQPLLLHELSSSLHDIYSISEFLQTFTQALKLIDFNHQHYLMPLEDEDNQIDELEFWAAALKLDAGAPEPIDAFDYEPGIQREKNGPIVRFSALSSGEQQILSLLIKLFAKAGPHTVFLIDEPEISLHVRWQQQLPALFSLVAEAFGCSFVVATHSPIIVANASDEISHCFLARDQKLTRIEAHQRHSVESILLDGFKTYTPDSGEINERCAVLVSRAILQTNQPGRPDPNQGKKLIKALKIMKQTMNESTNKKHEARYKQDLKLIAQAEAAIKELFKRAKEGALR